ncbi:MAG: ABC transporter ATP-binding protein [Pseudonocardia sp.]|nr:ABC transporter ATP-binding protein [Pseudonocardia sp.]
MGHTAQNLQRYTASVPVPVLCLTEATSVTELRSPAQRDRPECVVQWRPSASSGRVWTGTPAGNQVATLRQHWIARGGSSGLIRLEKVTKTYHTIGHVRVPALCDIDLTIDRGEMVAVTGPSGSGTSTLINILGCLDVPSSGRYLLEGRDVVPLSKRQRAKVRASTIGFVFHRFDLLPDATVIRNVELPLVYAVRSRVRHEHALRALERVGLGGHDNDFPIELSPAQRRRAMIARALINDPKVLLQDDPTTELDVRSGQEIVQLYTELNDAGCTVIFSTHREDVAASARRIIRLSEGRIASDQRVIGRIHGPRVAARRRNLRSVRASVTNGSAGNNE